MSELNIDKLKAVALAATPGEWLYRTDPGNPAGFQHCVRLPGEFGAWVCDCLDNADKLTAGGKAGERNAAYIAAANPAAVLALIAEIERLRAASPAPAAAPLSDAKDAERRGHYDDAKLRDIGAETYRACGELPIGYEIIIELEEGAGTVLLRNPDGNEQCFEGSDYFANDIRNAIDAAITAAKETA